MYEHPYYQFTRHEQEELARTAELHRFIAEHADQIVPRREGAIMRTLRRMIGAAPHRDARCRPVCDPAAAR
ncbi:hypothetical protein [Microbacterium sp.]|uniref:hypothetical protein n=1 Tax=Microbacterium sp. TaxID=51671 RepID=UPI0039E2FB1C